MKMWCLRSPAFFGLVSVFSPLRTQVSAGSPLCLEEVGSFCSEKKLLTEQYFLRECDVLPEHCRSRVSVLFQSNRSARPSPISCCMRRASCTNWSPTNQPSVLNLSPVMVSRTYGYSLHVWYHMLYFLCHMTKTGAA